MPVTSVEGGGRMQTTPERASNTAGWSPSQPVAASPAPREQPTRAGERPAHRERFDPTHARSSSGNVSTNAELSVSEGRGASDDPREERSDLIDHPREPPRPVENSERLWKTGGGETLGPLTPETTDAKTVPLPSDGDRRLEGHLDAKSRPDPVVPEHGDGDSWKLNHVIHEEKSITYSKKEEYAIFEKSPGLRGDTVLRTIREAEAPTVLVARGGGSRTAVAGPRVGEAPRTEVWADRFESVPADAEGATAEPTRLFARRSTSFPQAAALLSREAIGAEPLAEPRPVSKTVLAAAASPREEPAGQDGAADGRGQKGGSREDARNVLPESRSARAVRRGSGTSSTFRAETSEAPQETGSRPVGSRWSAAGRADRVATSEATSEAPGRPTHDSAEGPMHASGVTRRMAAPGPENVVSGRQPVSSQSAPQQPFVPTVAPAEASLRPLQLSGERIPAPPTPGAERPDAALQIAASEFRRGANSTRLTLVVEDDRLGSLAVRLAERGGGVEVMLRADNPTTAKQFQNSLPQLYENLLQRGLQPDARAWTPSATADSDREQHQQEHRERESRQQSRSRRGRNQRSQATFSIPVS